MNAACKVVFSRTLTTAEWANTTIAAGDTTEEIDKLRRGGDGGAQGLVKVAGTIDGPSFTGAFMALEDGAHELRWPLLSAGQSARAAVTTSTSISPGG